MIIFKDGDAGNKIAGLFANYNTYTTRYEINLLYGDSSHGNTKRIYEIDNKGIVYMDIEKINMYTSEDSSIEFKSGWFSIGNLTVYYRNGLIYKVVT